MLVFDTTALIALLDSHRSLVEAWQSADRGEISLAFPAAALADAGQARGVLSSAWDVLLWPSRVLVTPLSGPIATEIGEWTGSLAVRHVLWESRHLDWPIVTRNRRLYGPDAKALET